MGAIYSFTSMYYSSVSWLLLFLFANFEYHDHYLDFWVNIINSPNVITSSLKLVLLNKKYLAY